MFSDLGRRLFKDESLLDDARYIAVATGRLEPYKRVLAQQTLFYSKQIPLDPNQLQIEKDGTVFLKLWATRSRAKKAGLKKIQSASFNEIYKQLKKILTAEESANRKDINPSTVGILIDAGLPNEIYIEPHHLTEIYDLGQNLPTPSAFTPIAAESVYLEPKILITAAGLPEPLKTHLPLKAFPRHCRLKLNGLNGQSWNLLFLEINQVDLDAIPNLQMRYPHWLIIPQQCNITWVENILEEYRSEAIPVSLENRA